MTGNIPPSSKGKTGKTTVIEDVEYDVDELPDSNFSMLPQEYLINRSWEVWCSSIVKVCGLY